MPQPDETLETKAFGAFEVKDAERGEVTAIVATLNVVDRDGDVILPGAIADGTRVKLSAYNHDIIYEDRAPAGVGTITTKGDQVMLDAQFFMDTTRGRDAFHTAKGLGTEGEWSIGFPRKAVESATMTEGWRSKGARRIIAKMPVIEASPVFVGAGIGTQTVAAKAAEDAAAALAADAETKAAAEQAARDAEALKAKQVNEEAARIFARGRRFTTKR